MSNSQLYLSVGIPFFMVLIGILFGHHWANGINSRLDRFEGATNLRFGQAESSSNERFTQLESRIGRLEGSFNGRFTQIESRIGRLEAAVNEGFLQIQSDLKAFYRDLGRHDAEIAHLKERKAG